MITLKDYFTFADAQAFAALHKANPYPEGNEYSSDVSNKWFTFFHEAREEHIVKPAMEFFTAKLAFGELKPVANSQGYDLNFATAWDGLVTGKGDEYTKHHAFESMKNIFGYLLISPSLLLYKLDDETTDDELQTMYDDFIAYIDAGDFAWHATSERSSCGNTGKYLSIAFENWTPVIGKLVDRKWVPCEPIAPVTAPETLQIEFKTGNLVAMDWFRFEDALRKWTDTKGADDLPSIGSRVGVIASTRFYADLGIVHVFVGNSCPRMFYGNGIIACGSNWREYNEDGSHRYSDDDDSDYDEATENPPVGMEDYSSVCTDLWWVTMMERERLIEILVEQLGEDRRAEIEEYAASDFDVNMQVEPGKYTLHFDGHPSSFYPLLDDKTKFGIGTPYFALTKDTHENIAGQSTI